MRCCLLVMLAACSYSPQELGGPGTDASNTGDAPPGALCVGQFATVCLKHPPTASFQLGSDTKFDTGVIASCAETTAGTTVTACVIAATDITIDAKLTALGPRPLVLLATGTITVDATASIDAASHRGGTRGAGANPAGQCNLVAPTESGGGAGGSFVGSGGAGGTGTIDGFTSGGLGGATNPAGVPTTLRGGCAGGLGGNALDATGGGDGGGAVWLLAGTSITMSGTINASGAGGAGGKLDGATFRGGAGGGSGGMIVFDSVTLAIDGTVFAQGGAGGEGNDPDGLLVSNGDNGDDPGSPGNRANGGSGGNGQNGGDGGVGDSDDGPDGQPGDPGSSTAGGGGGGGTGFITIIAPSGSTTTGTIAPTPQS